MFRPQLSVFRDEVPPSTAKVWLQFLFDLYRRINNYVVPVGL